MDKFLSRVLRSDSTNFLSYVTAHTPMSCGKNPFQDETLEKVFLI